MTGRLNGKVALVTAAGHGIGRASAFAMARQGAKVQAIADHYEAVRKVTAAKADTMGAHH